MSDFGKLLKTKRKEKALTQFKLCALLGKKGQPLHRSIVSRWEIGERLPNPTQREAVLAIADVLDMSDIEKNDLLVKAELGPLQPQDIDVDRVLQSLTKTYERVFFLYDKMKWDEKSIATKLNIPRWTVEEEIEKARLLEKEEPPERSLIVWVRQAGGAAFDIESQIGGRLVSFTLGNCSGNVLTVEKICLEVLRCESLDLPPPIEARAMTLKLQVKLRPEPGEYLVTDHRFRYAGRDADDFDLVCDSPPGFKYKGRLKVHYSDLATRKQFTSYSDAFRLYFYKEGKVLRTHAEMAELKAKLRGMIPEITQSVIQEWELLSGTKKKIPISSDLLDSLMVLSAEGLAEIHDLATALGDAEVAKYELAFINSLLAKALEGIPPNMEPVDYVMREIENLCAVPPEIVIPLGLDYESKHRGLREFVNEAVSLVDPSKINDLLKHIFQKHELVSQLQRAFNKKLLPEELGSQPIRVNLRTAEKIKIGLREVTADWEHFITFVYGLWSLKKGTKRNISDLLGDHLRNKVEAICIDTRLAAVAKQDWVTVRNALDHGRAPFNPQQRKIEFRDVRRSVSWDLKQCWLEGCEIYLANIAMWCSLTFLNAAALRKWLDTLKNRAR